METSGIKYLQITLTDAEYARLNHYARYINNPAVTATSLGQQIVRDWIDSNTDPIVVKWAIARMVNKMVKEALKKRG